MTSGRAAESGSTAQHSRPTWCSTPPADPAGSPAACAPGPSIGGPCGIAYVDRQYQLRDGVPTPPLANPLAWQGDYQGYQVIIFLHERGIFSTLIIRNTSDRSLVALRHNDAFDAAARAIPGLAAWTDPAVSRPITDVLPGGPLLNHYRSQRRADGCDRVARTDLRRRRGVHHDAELRSRHHHQLPAGR